MMKKQLTLFFAIFCIAGASNARTTPITIRTNTSESIYLTTSNGSTTVGYSFLLQQNVISVRVNATRGSTRLLNSTFSILPNFFLESNETYSIYQSRNVRSFLDFLNDSADWGPGLILSRRTEDVYQIQSEWKDPVRKPLKFAVNCYISTTATKYQGVDLKPYEITMFFSILDFPFVLDDSYLAYDQIQLTGRQLTNATRGSSYLLDSGGLASLLIDTTAIVDGKDQPVTKSFLDNGTAKLLISNQTNVNTAGLFISEALFSFMNSNKAKNITLQQRLVYNTTVHNAVSHSRENAAVEKTGLVGCIVVLILCGAAIFLL